MRDEAAVARKNNGEGGTAEGDVRDSSSPPPPATSSTAKPAAAAAAVATAALQKAWEKITTAGQIQKLFQAFIRTTCGLILMDMYFNAAMSGALLAAAALYLSGPTMLKLWLKTIDGGLNAVFASLGSPGRLMLPGLIIILRVIPDSFRGVPFMPDWWLDFLGCGLAMKVAAEFFARNFDKELQIEAFASHLE